MDTLPGRLVEGYFNDLNANEIQGRGVSACRLLEPSSSILGGKYIMESGIASL